MKALAKPLFRGWSVVATAFMVATFTWGIGFYGLSVFLEQLHHNRHWPIPIISAAITAHFLISAILVSFLHVAHERFGIARTTRAGIMFMALGILVWAFATAPWQLFGAALLTGVGWAANSGAGITAMVSRWFNRRRPIALGLALNGSSLGGVLFTPMWVALSAWLSLPTATAVVCVAMLIMLWPLSGRFLSSGPADFGLLPDGDSAPAAPGRAASTGSTPIPVKVLLRNRQFTTLSLAFALGLFAQVGVAIHLVARLTPNFGVQNAAAAVSLVTACAIISRILLGAFMGNADRRLVGLGNFALKAFGISCLAIGHTEPVLLIGCGLFGFGMGNLLLLAPLIAQREFAASDVPRVVSLVTAGNQALFAFAPAFFGVVSQFSEGYSVPFIIAALIEIVAGVVLLLGRTRVPAGAELRGV